MGAAGSVPAAESHRFASDVLRGGRPIAVLLAIASRSQATSTSSADSHEGEGMKDVRIPVLPVNLDDEFYANLFCDFVAFEMTAEARHRAAFRSLCRTACSEPNGSRAAVIALVVRAAICRIRDYVAAPTAAYEIEQVLGAMLLAVRVLDALVEERASDKNLCLVLGAGPAIPQEDRIDIGQSVLWQLITSALDCIAAWNDESSASSGILIAAVNLILVALSTTHLSPHRQRTMGADSFLPLAASMSSPGTRTARHMDRHQRRASHSQSGPVSMDGRASLSCSDSSIPGSVSVEERGESPKSDGMNVSSPGSDKLRDGQKKLEDVRFHSDRRAAASKSQRESLLATIVNRYPRPDTVVAALLNYAILASARRDALSHLPASVSSPISAFSHDSTAVPGTLQSGDGHRTPSNGLIGNGFAKHNPSPTLFASNLVATVSKQLALGFASSTSTSERPHDGRSASEISVSRTHTYDDPSASGSASLFSSVTARWPLLRGSILTAPLVPWAVPRVDQAESRKVAVDKDKTGPCSETEYVSVENSAAGQREKCITSGSSSLEHGEDDRNSCDSARDASRTTSVSSVSPVVYMTSKKPSATAFSQDSHSTSVKDDILPAHPENNPAMTSNVPLSSFGPKNVHVSSQHDIVISSTALGKQALGLLSVLCVPPGPSSSGSSMTTFHGENREMRSATAAEEISTTSGEEIDSVSLSEASSGLNTGNGSISSREFRNAAHQDVLNPFRASLLRVHDKTVNESGDECVVSFSSLYEALGKWCGEPRAALIAYLLIEGNKRFRTYVLARTDPDVLLIPLLAIVYTRSSALSPTAPADVYIPAIVLLILSSDSGFCDAINDISIPSSNLPWFADRIRLGGAGINLSGLVLLVCIRSIQQSLVAKRRVMESYMASVCMSVAANVSSSVSEISSLAADRLVALIDFIGKRRRRFLLLVDQDLSMPLSPPAVSVKASSHNGYPCLRSTHTSCHRDCVTKSRSTASDADRHAHSSMSSPRGSGAAAVNASEVCKVVFLKCGTEASDVDSVETLGELMGTALEIVTSILRAASNVCMNKHLVYSLLHKEALFTSSSVADVSPRVNVLIERIRSLIRFFGGFLEAEAAVAKDQSISTTALATPTTYDLSSAAKGSYAVTDGVQESNSRALGIRTEALSVDRVLDMIDRCSRKFPTHILGGLPDIRFEYCEALSSFEFFLPHAWVLAMRDSPLQWETSKFPDATVSIFESVFHAPRPSHGSSKSSAN